MNNYRDTYSTDTAPQDNDIVVEHVKWMIDCNRCGGDGMVIDEEAGYTEFDDELGFIIHSEFKRCPCCDGRGFHSKPIGPRIK